MENIGTSVTLNNGKTMPLLGLGTWKSAPGEVARAVEHAEPAATGTSLPAAVPISIAILDSVSEVTARLSLRHTHPPR